MNPSDEKRFKKLYQRYLQLLKLRRYAHLTTVIEKESRSTINKLINALHVDLKKV